tara:strand:- start:374 stop:577 length:204 start_codon:yes stop_codon:yes gene_type:complete
VGENLKNYEVVLTEERILCYYVEAESDQVALDEVTTAWAEGYGGEPLEIEIVDRKVTEKVAHVMEQY